jgi:RNA polymerase sigma-70 factor (ECF subfamily)
VRLQLVPASPDEPAGEDRRLTVEEAYRAHASYVAAIGLRILGRREEVDDLVQEVFLSAHRGLDALREPGALRGWLANLAVRLARRKLRARRIKLILGIERDYDYAGLADPRLSPEDNALLGEVYRTLDRIPVPERVAWCLRYVDGERLDQVARLCGCSLATAKRRIAAAHAKILEETSHG